MGKDEFLYQKTYEQLKAFIRSRECHPGLQLPTEQELKDRYAVSIITIKKAMGILAEEGYIKRIPGKGTFVQALEKEQGGSRQEPGDTPLLGVVIEHVATPFGLDMIYQMDKTAEENGYKLLTRFSYGRRDKENEEIAFLLSLAVKGLVVIPSHGEHYNPTLLKLSLEEFPLVLVDKKLGGIPVPSVRTDNADAMDQLVGQAVADGCLRLALISTDSQDATSTEERKWGYDRALKDRGLESAGECILRTKKEMTAHGSLDETIEEIARFLLEKKGGVDGILCSEYGIVPTLVRACGRMGLLPDQDFRLYTIDEDYLAPAGFTFTHAKQDEARIGEQAVSLLLDRISGREILVGEQLVPPLLRCRKRETAG